MKSYTLTAETKYERTFKAVFKRTVGKSGHVAAEGYNLV